MSVLKPHTKLLSAIREKGWRQTDLAKKSGIIDPVISQTITGRYNMDEKERRLVCEALGVSVKSIFGDE